MGAGQGSRNASDSSNSSANTQNYVRLNVQADRVWKQVFAEDAFTSLTIADFVLKKTGTSLKDYLSAPKKLKDKVDIKMIPTWANLEVLVNGPGRCASFAVKVCSTLSKTYAGQYDFKFYNIGSHRIARCDKNKVVIDSSSEFGAFELFNNDIWMGWKDFQEQWKYAPGETTMYFRKKPADKPVFSKQITWNEAIALSANQLAANSKPVLATLFRDVEDFAAEESQAMKTIFRVNDEQNHGKKVYKAMLRWDLTKRHLECWKSLNEPESVTVISWKINGTDAQEKECVKNFHSFVGKFGVQAQWVRKNGTADGQQMVSLEDIHWDVWTTATDLWGKPSWSIVDMSKK